MGISWGSARHWRVTRTLSAVVTARSAEEAQALGMLAIRNGDFESEGLETVPFDPPPVRDVLAGVTVITPEGTTTGTIRSDDSIALDDDLGADYEGLPHA